MARAAKSKVALSVDAEAVTAPSVRIFTDWTPAKLRAAERLAEHGDLSQAVSVCEWLLTDDRIASALSARVDALMGLDPTFEPGLGRRSKQAQRAMEAEEDWWESYPESELAQILTWGILLGLAPARHRWIESEEHGGRVLPMPAFWHPQTMRLDLPTRQWSTRDYMHQSIPVVAGDGTWILHTPYGADRPWSMGLWRSLSRWALLKQLAVGDWARHSEKGSLLVATSPEGATPKQRRELAADLQNSGADTIVALAKGFDLKLLEVAANTKQIYQSQIEMADLAIAIRVRGGNLSTNVESGSLAAAKSQADTGDNAKLRADAQALSTTLHEQSLPWWAEFNFGDRKLAPWPVWPTEPDEDKSERATMINVLGDGLTKLSGLGYEVDDKALVDEFGLSFIKGRKKVQDPKTAVQDGKQGKPALRSGISAKAATGFVDGQTYVDDVADDGRDKSGKAIQKTLLAELMEVIKDHDDYEGLRAAVLERYSMLKPPSEVRDLIRKALVLADLAGAKAVRDDI